MPWIVTEGNDFPYNEWGGEKRGGVTQNRGEGGGDFSAYFP